LVVGIALAVIAAGAIALNADSAKSDKQQIIDLENGLIKATNAKNVDGMMSYYDSSDRLIIFDAIPPLEYSGPQAWRKNLEGLWPRTTPEFWSSPIWRL